MAEAALPRLDAGEEWCADPPVGVPARAYLPVGGPRVPRLTEAGGAAAAAGESPEDAEQERQQRMIAAGRRGAPSMEAEAYWKTLETERGARTAAGALLLTACELPQRPAAAQKAQRASHSGSQPPGWARGQYAPESML